MSNRNVEKVLMIADGEDAHRYCIVLCTDGTYAITKDDHIYDGQVWNTATLDECTREFLRLTGLRNSSPERS